MKPFRIVHFSDIHEARPMRTAGGFLDKRIVGAVNSFFRRRKCFLRANIAPAVERILADPPDAVVFSGDAATCGQPSEFRQALDDLKPLTESGIPLLFSPGNHDAYVRDRACRNALRDFVEELTNGRQTLDGYPSVFDPGLLRFLVFNAARPTNPLLSCGFLDEASQELIRRECLDRTKPLVAVCHFPFRRIRHGLVNGFRHRLFGTREAVDFLNGGRLDLVLCGHIHFPYFDLDSTGRGETSCGSLTRNGAYSVIEFADGVFHHSRVEVK